MCGTDLLMMNLAYRDSYIVLVLCRDHAQNVFIIIEWSLPHVSWSGMWNVVPWYEYFLFVWLTFSPAVYKYQHHVHQQACFMWWWLCNLCAAETSGGKAPSQDYLNSIYEELQAISEKLKVRMTLFFSSSYWMKTNDCCCKVNMHFALEHCHLRISLVMPVVLICILPIHSLWHVYIKASD